VAFYRSSLRADPRTAPGQRPGTPSGGPQTTQDRAPLSPAASGPRHRRDFGRSLYERLEALRELVVLSRTRLDTGTLAEASRVLEEAGARHRLSLDHTVIAVAGSSGSGKSTLFNTLAGAPLSEAGVRRPTTSAPVACTWSDDAEGADGLLDRLGIPPRLRRRPPRPDDPVLQGLVLIDLPDHDSAVSGHRDQVDRMLRLVDAVVWVADPEKYADAALHENYLRPLAGYCEVTFVLLNQVDRLPADATDQVLDDLRRLLDDDGLALGEHGEPGATVLPVSGLTGEGVAELRYQLGRFCQEGRAAERRLKADVERVTDKLRDVYLAEGCVRLTEEAQAEFDDRLAEAVGAVAAGQAAERAWLRYAEMACGVPWGRVRRWHEGRRTPLRVHDAVVQPRRDPGPASGTRHPAQGPRPRPEHRTGRPDPGRAADGAVTPQGVKVLDVAKVLDGANGQRPGTASGTRPATRPGGATGTEPGRWRGRSRGETPYDGRAAGGSRFPVRSRAGIPAVIAGGGGPAAAPEAPKTARPIVEQAVRRVVEDASAGLPDAWAQAVREAASRGAGRLPETLDEAAAAQAAGTARPSGPRWWALASAAQGVLLLLHVVGGLWLLWAVVSGPDAGGWPTPALVMAIGVLGAPMLAWSCRTAARGPARRYGQEAERRLRGAAAACGRAHVLEPVAAELLRYRDVRDRYLVAAGGAAHATLH
jgi:energy-coupling factor transporter ATP-binding protein EcfA2